MLTLCRLVLGLAVGIAAVVAPLYISESAPAARRGMLVSVYQLAITLGILAAYLVNYAFDDRWRHMFMLGALPGIALFVGMFMLRDTPRWYMLKGRPDQARAALEKLRGHTTDPAHIDAEMQAIAQSGHRDESTATWADLLSPTVRPAFMVGIGLFFLQQLSSGINAVIYYAPTVFNEAGFDSGSTQLLATIGVGVVNVLMTLVGMALIDRLGRLRLLYFGFFGTAVSLGLIALGAATGAQALDVLAVVGLLGYIASFAASIGPLPWVMMSEIFPGRVRGLAMSVTSLSNWAFNFLVVFSFPVLVASLGLGWVFGLYAFVCALGVFFTWRWVPETSGVTLEAIEQHLLSGKSFKALQAEATVQLHTDKPDIPLPVATELMVAVMRLSPYRQHLEPLSECVGQVAHQNVQVRTALRELYARVGPTPGGGWALRHADLGPQQFVLFAFLEHVRFASPAFLESVGEGANTKVKS